MPLQRENVNWSAVYDAPGNTNKNLMLFQIQNGDPDPMLDLARLNDITVDGNFPHYQSLFPKVGDRQLSFLASPRGGI